jgi:uncharacterized protein YbaP (TraB family)
MKLKFLVFLIAVFMLSCTQSRFTPALFLVEDEDSKIYLMGSMHIGNSSMSPMPEYVTDALLESEGLYLELDVDDPEVSRKAMIYEKKYSIPYEESLTPVQVAEVNTYLDENNLSWLKRMNLSYFSLTEFISMYYAESVGFSVVYGVERQLIRLANANNMEIGSLENIDDYINLFKAFNECPYTDINELQKDYLLEELKHTATYWKKGDIDKVFEMYSEEMTKTEEDKAFYKVFLIDRNKKMADSIISLIENAETYFCAAGALHLPGEEGILKLLEEEGYFVTRIQ